MPEPRYSLRVLHDNEFEILEKRRDDLIEAGATWENATAQAVSEMDKLTEDKVLSYAARIKNLELLRDAALGESEAFHKEAERLASNGKRFEAEIDALKDRMLLFLPHDGEWKDHRFKVSFKRTEVLDDSKVLDVRALPASVVRLIPEKAEVNKVEAKKLLKQGEVIPGLSLLEKFSVFIR